MGRKNGWDVGGGRGDVFAERRDDISRHRALQSGQTGRPRAALPDPETQQEWNWWEHSAVETVCPLPLRPRQMEHGLLSMAVMLLRFTKQKQQKFFCGICEL